MPVVAAVLHASPDRLDALVRDLSADPRLTLGEPVDGRLPVVAETASRHEDKHLWRALERRDDVRFLELAFADFSDIHPQGG